VENRHRKLIENQIKRKVWNWIGHTLRKETGATEKTALDWNPQGYRRRGRLKRTWRREIEGEILSTTISWNEVKEELLTAVRGSSSFMSYGSQGVKCMDDNDDYLMYTVNIQVVCSVRWPKIANSKQTKLHIYFSPNATTCHLWTSWSSLLGMAAV
jgi:hypothetical protein